MKSKALKKLIQELKSRWQTESPLFFKKVIQISVFVSGMALAMHLAMDSSGANEPFIVTGKQIGRAHV